MNKVSINDIVKKSEPKYQKRDNIKEEGLSIMGNVESKIIQLYFDKKMPHATYDWTNRNAYIYTIYSVIKELYLSKISEHEYNNIITDIIENTILNINEIHDTNVFSLNKENVYLYHIYIINKLINKYIEDTYDVLNIFGIDKQPCVNVNGKQTFGCLHIFFSNATIVTNTGRVEPVRYNLCVLFNDNVLKNDEVKHVENITDVTGFKKFLVECNSKTFKQYQNTIKNFQNNINLLKQNIQHDILDLMNDGYNITQLPLKLN